MKEARDPEAVAALETALAGKYKIVRRIGAGGMGEVYLATDLRHDRQVAVKVMRTDWDGPDGAERFLREISIAGKLSHPNIVPMYDSGQDGSLVYYVMPYVEGQSLRDRITQEVQLPLAEALQITVSVAEALTYAHSRGIVHRDIKPENIILESGRAVVTDFGIAKITAGEGLTSGRAVIGTPPYMSPEQASASGKLDQRSDLYSLALVLYEMLAGDVPFRAATPEGMFARKAIGRYAPVRDARKAIPEYIDDALARALQPVPADRFASVSEFAAALRGSDVTTPKRRPRIQRLSLLAVAILLVGSVAVLMLTHRGPFANSSAPVIGLGRVVVAPLENRTGLASLNVVGDMAGDWITEGLQKTGIVEVVPTTAVAEATRDLARGTDNATLDPRRTLAGETGANTVVSGAIYRQNDRLLFRVSIADRAGTRLVGTISDVVASITQPVLGVEELRNRLMGWLAVRYDDRLQAPGAGADRAPTYEAYSAFSEAMNHYVAVENAQALPLFLQAFKLDSSFTVALLYASISLTNLGEWPRADSLLRIVNSRRGGLSAYNQALLDYRLGFVHGKHDAALAAIREAAKQAPASKASYNHALEAFYGGYLREALTALRSMPTDRGAMRGFAPYWDIYATILHALRLYDAEYGAGRESRRLYPDRLTMFTALARAFAATGRLDSLAATMREAEGVPTDPVGWDYGHLLAEAAEELRAHGNPGAANTYFERLRKWLITSRSPTSRWRLVKTLYWLGRWDDAGAQLTSLRRSDATNVEYLGMSGLIRARKGEKEQARLVVDSLTRDQRPYQFGLGTLYRARIAAVLGDRDLAMVALREALTEGTYDLEWHRDIDLESLRGYAPFERLLQGRN